VDDGQWLIEHRADMDRAEARWLQRLAQFDRDGLWALDGQLSCAGWLVWRTRMARSTAFEKLRVAHELERRPIVAEAFQQGRLSYSAVRAMTRLDRPDPAVDEALVELAQSGEASILDLERAVRAYGLYADQERPPPDDADRVRDVKILRGDDGTGQIIVTLGDLELEEFAATFQAFLDLRYRPQAVDESSPADGPGEARIDEAPIDEPSRSAIKANAFLDLVRTALAHADGGHAAGGDRYLVHVVTRDCGRSFSQLDGTPVHPTDAAMVTCDTSTVTHTVSANGEPLNLGRKTGEWSTAQRRAISVRDGGQCRFAGCYFRHCDIHHMHPWEAGANTDIDNGFYGCPRHHRMLHRGYRVDGDPNGELRFYRPDGSYLGSTHPALARMPVTDYPWRAASSGLRSPYSPNQVALPSLTTQLSTPSQ
jgi:hypothetical protein